MTGRLLPVVIVRAGALLVVWLVLTLTLEAFYVGLGLVTACAVAWANTREPGPDGLRWTGLVLYAPWVLWQVILSGVHLCYLILHPRLPIDPKLLRYQTTLTQPAAVVIFGNSITLTPGTITAEVQGDELVVHAMDDEASSGLGAMERTIGRRFGVKGGRP
jgi:multicomponent Na+:H+ antiporter subunit E